MTREIALHCMKSYSELHSDLCELCPIYGQTGSDHCFEDALQYVIGMLEQEPTTKNNLGVDCIDRAKAQTEIEMNAFRYTLAKERGGTGEVEWDGHLIAIDDAVDIIRNLPSATPQEPKTGHKVSGDLLGGLYCSECMTYVNEYFNYCPHCGAKMESEDKE